MAHLPDSADLRLVEGIERKPPPGAEAIHWRLLTTHAVAEKAWTVADRQRHHTPLANVTANFRRISIPSAR